MTHIPNGYAKVKILKAATTYAREELPAGMTAIVDADTAARWIKEKRAQAVEAGPPRTMIATICPKCHSAMEYPEIPEESERWTQCKNLQCNHGWMR